MSYPIKATRRAKRWLFGDRDAAAEFFAKEIQLAPELALEILPAEIQAVRRDPSKFIDQCYWQQALKELSSSKPP